MQARSRSRFLTFSSTTILETTSKSPGHIFVGRKASELTTVLLPVLRSKCIHLLDYFDDRNHICIVTELLSTSVFDFLKDNHYAPFPPNQIQNFAKQLLGSVACKYLCCTCLRGPSEALSEPFLPSISPVLHDLKLIHTDLKPENILLVDNDCRVIPGDVSLLWSRLINGPR
jgi:serine/threonine protein kinase